MFNNKKIKELEEKIDSLKLLVEMGFEDMFKKIKGIDKRSQLNKKLTKEFIKSIKKTL